MGGKTHGSDSSAWTRPFMHFAKKQRPKNPQHNRYKSHISTMISMSTIFKRRPSSSSRALHACFQAVHQARPSKRTVAVTTPRCFFHKAHAGGAPVQKRLDAGTEIRVTILTRLKKPHAYVNKVGPPDVVPEDGRAAATAEIAFHAWTGLVGGE